MDRKVIDITNNYVEFNRMIHTSRGPCLIQKRISVNKGKVSMKIKKRFLNN